jgi:uncharacterized membrane protein YdbT with pleckstrin-like domain
MKEIVIVIKAIVCALVVNMFSMFILSFLTGMPLEKAANYVRVIGLAIGTIIFVNGYSNLKSD